MPEPSSAILGKLHKLLVSQILTFKMGEGNGGLGKLFQAQCLKLQLHREDRESILATIIIQGLP